MDKYVIAPPSGSTQNSVGASDRPWKEGHFDSIKLNGGDLGEYLAESTGYGIVSGCEPSISGLTVTVGAGVVHLADGTRKEISATNITLDPADSTNPRIDLVYINTDGTVAKITGTASANPSAPSVPTGGISVAQVNVAANASTGIIWDKRYWLVRGDVTFLFPKTQSYSLHGDCQIIKTEHNVMMIDTGNVDTGTYDYILDYLNNNGIFKINYLLITHYHRDHVANLENMLMSNKIDWTNTRFFLPMDIPNITGSTNYATVCEWIGNNGSIIKCEDNMTFNLEPDVKVDLFNCSAADREHYQSLGITTLNTYSIYALITHKNVRAMFTGDGFGAESWLYNNGFAVKTDLYKVPHHGCEEPDNIPHDNKQWLDAIKASYCLFNCAAEVWEKADYNKEISYFAMLGGKVGWLALGSAKFISDGYKLAEGHENSDVLITQNNPLVQTFYVNPNSNSAHPDGSQSNPFPSILQALARVPKETQVKLNLADGTYDEIYINDKPHVVLSFSKITVGNLYIKNSYVEISQSDEITINKMTMSASTLGIGANKINFEVSGTRRILISHSVFYTSSLTTQVILSAAGATSTSSQYSCMVIQNSRVTLPIVSVSHIYCAFVLQGASNLFISNISCDYTYEVFADGASDGFSVINTASVINLYGSGTKNKLFAKNLSDRGQVIYVNSPFS